MTWGPSVSPDSTLSETVMAPSRPAIFLLGAALARAAGSRLLLCGAAAARLRFGADSPTAQGPRWHGSARAHVAPLLLRDVARVLRVAQTRRWQAYAVRDSKAAAAGLILVYL